MKNTKNTLKLKCIQNRHSHCKYWHSQDSYSELAGERPVDT